ncbi:uncharacterized protein RSE6_05876 [Rhynchosporium secalis]|uniref:Uncharacterized protein n=1 Tax=Rhynchosporium secalis TaxID=38038 RepID=A0A1E1M909_RHYSE|nr:uncharacterized protein RSE6_05876 [Rhynchosporium secalis]
MAGVMRGNYEKEIAYATDRAVQGLPSATAQSIKILAQASNQYGIHSRALTMAFFDLVQKLQSTISPGNTSHPDQGQSGISYQQMLWTVTSEFCRLIGSLDVHGSPEAW